MLKKTIVTGIGVGLLGSCTMFAVASDPGLSAVYISSLAIGTFAVSATYGYRMKEAMLNERKEKSTNTKDTVNVQEVQPPAKSE